MMLIGELKSWLSAFADDEEVAIVDCGGLSLETRTDGLAVGGWPEDGEELTCILTAENMHTADDCTRHDHEMFIIWSDGFRCFGKEEYLTREQAAHAAAAANTRNPFGRWRVA